MLECSDRQYVCVYVCMYICKHRHTHARICVYMYIQKTASYIRAFKLRARLFPSMAPSSRGLRLRAFVVCLASAAVCCNSARAACLTVDSGVDCLDVLVIRSILLDKVDMKRPDFCKNPWETCRSWWVAEIHVEACSAALRQLHLRSKQGAWEGGGTTKGFPSHVLAGMVTRILRLRSIARVAVTPAADCGAATKEGAERSCKDPEFQKLDHVSHTISSAEENGFSQNGASQRDAWWMYLCPR